MITAEWSKPEKVARVNLWTFWRRVAVPQEEYPAGKLCELLTERARPVPEIKVIDSHRNETIRLESAEMMLWEVLEAVYMQKGWVVREEGDRTLIIAAPAELGSVNDGR